MGAKDIRWRGVLVSSLLLVVVGTVFAAKQPAGSVLLQFKPDDGGPSVLLTTRREDIHQTSWGNEAQHLAVESKTTIRRSVELSPSGSLVVRLERLKHTVSVNGKPAPDITKKGQTSFQMDERGRAIAGASTTASVPDIRLVLPEIPVVPGATWTETIPASKAFPTSLEVSFEFIKRTPYRGRDCILIRSKCHREAFFPDRGCRARVSLISRLYFDVKAGQVAGSLASNSFILTYVTKYPGRPRQTATFTKAKTVVR